MLVTCIEDGDKCLYVQGTTPCPANMPCSGSAGAATCSCPSPPASCPGEGKFCAGTEVVTCVKDGVCLKESGRTTCTGGQVCAGAPNAICSFPLGIWDQSSWDQALWQ